MKKLVLIISSILAGIIFISILYFNSSNYIENQNWKYSDGKWFGDWFGKGSLKIENRVINTQNGKAKIIYCLMGRLVVENIETGERGTYINKN